MKDGVISHYLCKAQCDNKRGNCMFDNRCSMLEGSDRDKCEASCDTQRNRCVSQCSVNVNTLVNDPCFRCVEATFEKHDPSTDITPEDVDEYFGNAYNLCREKLGLCHNRGLESSVREGFKVDNDWDKNTCKRNVFIVTASLLLLVVIGVFICANKEIAKASRRRSSRH